MKFASKTLTPTISPTPYQCDMLNTPVDADLVNAGARGGGKSYGLALVAARDVREHGDGYRGLVLRLTLPSLRDLEDTFREVFGALFGDAATYNINDHLWKFWNGAVLELGFLDGEQSYDRYQGRSFTHLIIDEAGQFATPILIDRLLSNLRSGRGVKPRLIIAANPGGPGQTWISSRYVLKAAPREVTEGVNGRSFVVLPSTYRDNPHLDDGYPGRIRAATIGDEALTAAWLDGDWTRIRGQAFEIDADAVAVDPAQWCPEWFGAVSNDPDPIVRRYGPDGGQFWERSLAVDWGVADPFVAYVVAISPGAYGPDALWYPPGSIILLDEYDTHDPMEPSRGRGYLVPQVAEHLKALCHRWDVNPMSGDHVMDDSAFARTGTSSGSIADEFTKEGVRFRPARKGNRVPGWLQMRAMLAAAASPDRANRAGMYVSRLCEMWWWTTTQLPTDPKNRDDVDTNALDHWADASRYAITGLASGPNYTCGYTRDLW